MVNVVVLRSPARSSFMTRAPKPLRFSRHANEQMKERGAHTDEVVDAVRTGFLVPAKQGRQGYRKDFPYNRMWGGRFYGTKRVLVIVAERPDELVVVTVYTFYS
jgi:hypothetical protein